MNEEKSKLQLIGEIAQANNKNLELIEELNNKEDEIKRLKEQIEEYQKALDETTSEKVDLYSIIKEVREELIVLFGTDDKDINNILEMLDRENNNGS